MGTHEAPVKRHVRGEMRGRPGRVLRSVALALACLALGAGADATADSLDTRLRDFGIGPLSGEPPAVVLPDLEGRQVTLEGQRGRLVMLYFWATW